MCNRYVTPDERAIERMWNSLPETPFEKRAVHPRQQGPFLRVGRGSDRPQFVVGQWGLIPWFAKTAKLTYSTNNARFEELSAKASYKQPWAKGQRCIIPAESFDEPNWESGKNVWWRFRRADGDPWGLAGLWASWTDKTSGEVHESYTMLTLNADDHPLMKRMHKPDPKLPADQQDKRSVVAIERSDVDQWLLGTVEEAAALVKLTPAEAFEAGPAAN